MILAIGWLHDGGDCPVTHPAGGSMMVAIGWLHEGGETAEAWLHVGGDWQTANFAQLHGATA